MITGASSVVAIHMIEESRRFGAMKCFLYKFSISHRFWGKKKKNPKMVKYILL